MTRSIVEGSKFKKQYRKVSQYSSFKKNKFIDAVKILQQGETLPKNYDDHPVAKNSPTKLQGMRIIHLAPNICLLYELTKTDLVLHLIGSHQDLNLTEAQENNKLRIKLKPDKPEYWK